MAAKVWDSWLQSGAFNRTPCHVNGWRRRSSFRVMSSRSIGRCAVHAHRNQLFAKR